MTTGLATSRTWRGGQVVDDEVALDEIEAAAKDPTSLVWVDLVAPSHELLGEIVGSLGLASTAVEDALAPHERPKVTRHESHLFFTVYATQLDKVGRPARRGACGCTAFSASCCPRRWSPSASTGGSRWATSCNGGRTTPSCCTARTPSCTAYWTPWSTPTSRRSSASTTCWRRWRTCSSSEATTNREFVRRMYDVRKDLVGLRRVTLPMRQVVNGLLRHGQVHADLEPWVDDLYDHVLRASEWSESLRDLVTSMFEANLTLQDSRLTRS